MKRHRITDCYRNKPKLPASQTIGQQMHRYMKQKPNSTHAHRGQGEFHQRCQQQKHKLRRESVTSLIIKTKTDLSWRSSEQYLMYELQAIIPATAATS